ncbi:MULTISPECIES: Rrf2 family transcriptional regulator [unclassified Paenibacillus]|uniref:RrF2 family transcriptional regulator n=1 Tax=unclassified Paenibacillus TaxID=185978 RepID=UPI001C102C58|nr:MULTISPECIES: Rrf2 family transcriptional regulator [unclassified Paenibacillus]MBU5441151.1 Rrf2 family transcriptional regulator [Paenibacillus sp. MSJ-34]CAH0120525.1 hypothetical protein PAE9249_03044 [Paenibacillus sp. CECT 9249]
MKTEKSSCPPNYKSFGLAIQALVMMSKCENRCPSGEIADYLQSEPTLLRRIMARLVQNNIVETREGRDGGYRLKKAPEAITLADVLTALEGTNPLKDSMLDSTGDHAFGLCMNSIFTDISSELDSSIAGVLSRYTIKDIADSAAI